MITAVEDPGAVFFDNGFSIDDKKKSPWSGYNMKIPNPFSWTALTFIKRLFKENAYIVRNLTKFNAIILSHVIALNRLMLTVKSPFYPLSKWMRNHSVKISFRLISWVVTLRKNNVREKYRSKHRENYKQRKQFKNYTESGKCFQTTSQQKSVRRLWCKT